MMQTVGAHGYAQRPQVTPSANAVNIQIFDPVAYGAPTTPVQQPVYSYPDNSMYAQPQVNPYQSYIPQQQIYSPAPQYTPSYQPQAAQVQPQPMPAPVLNPQEQQAPVQMPAPAAAQAPVQQPQAQPTAEQSQVQQPQAQPAPEQPQVQPQVNVQEPQMPDQNGVDVNALVAGLQSQDNKTQEEAITAVANLSQGDPAKQNAVLTEPVMTSLANIIAQDTSKLEGPTDAQIAALNKAATGGTLTPEEQQLTQNLAPKTAADKNKVISMFTLAMLQKNQREELDKYNQTQAPQNQLPQLKASDLIGFDAVSKAAQNPADKEVQLAAIQALSYSARPEDKDILAPVFQAAAQSSTEPLIQQTANEALANIGVQVEQPKQAEQAGQTQQAQEPDVSKMSRKERKAYEKAQKEAQKQAQGK